LLPLANDLGAQFNRGAEFEAFTGVWRSVSSRVMTVIVMDDHRDGGLRDRSCRERLSKVARSGGKYRLVAFVKIIVDGI
jgi:hypothetical protein